MTTTIGIMIAAYILTRMAELLQARAQTDFVTKTLAGITAIIAIICGLVLFVAGVASR